jgi:hypothetical protein
MNGLRWFLRDQVQLAQEQLHDLLLLPAGEADMRQGYVPALELSTLNDDPSNRVPVYSFLHEPRNHELLGGKQRYLLHHRYLPKEVSELLVYYLWLILPFWQQLDILVYRRKEPASTYLWPRGNGTWDPSRLTRVISREARLCLDTALGIPTYRHLAIAISRQHLSCDGFKRDYGVDKKLADEQATHGTWIAGTVYARGL